MALSRGTVNGVEGMLCNVIVKEFCVCFTEVVIHAEEIHIIVVVENKSFPILRGDGIRPDITIVERRLANAPAA